MTYSSISHISWLLSSLSLGKYFWINYFFIYSFVLTTILFSFYKLNVNNLSEIFLLKKRKTKNILIINILSLAGLPPFSGFLAKILIISALIESTKIFITIFLLFSTILRLFFYIRMITRNIFNSNSKTIKITKNKYKPWLILTINLRGLLVAFPLSLVLDFKLFKLKAFKALKKNIS